MLLTIIAKRQIDIERSLLPTQSYIIGRFLREDFIFFHFQNLKSADLGSGKGKYELPLTYC